MKWLTRQYWSWMAKWYHYRQRKRIEGWDKKNGAPKSALDAMRSIGVTEENVQKAKKAMGLDEAN